MEMAFTAIRGLGQKGIDEIKNALTEWKESGIEFDSSAIDSTDSFIVSGTEIEAGSSAKEDKFITHVHAIQLLPLTPGMMNALIKAGITTVEGALKLENLLDGIPGLGAAGAERVKQSLDAWKKTKMVSEHLQAPVEEEIVVTFVSFKDLFQQIVNRYTTGKKGGTTENRRGGIIMARFTGHTSYDEKPTLEDIGQKFGLTRERVRQICEQFMLYLDFYFGYYLRQRMLDFSDALGKKGVFDFDTFTNITASVFPEFSNSDFFDFLHLLEVKDEIFEVTNEVQAHEKLLLFSYRLDPAKVAVIRSCISDCVIKNGMTSADEVVAYVASEFKIENEVVRRIISYSRILAINNGEIVRKKMTRSDMLLAVFEKEGRDMHFSEVAKLVNERFNLDIVGHNAQGVMLADERFIWVGQGRFSIARPGLLRGRTEEVIEHYLKSRGGSATLQEIIQFMKTQRLLSDAAISLGIQRSVNIVRVKPGFFRIKEPHERKMDVQLANTTIKLKQGLIQILEEASEPLSNIELAQKIKERFGDRCSSDTKTISVYLNRDMKHLVHKNPQKKYMLHTKLNIT